MECFLCLASILTLGKLLCKLPGLVVTKDSEQYMPHFLHVILEGPMKWSVAFKCIQSLVLVIVSTVRLIPHSTKIRDYV